MTTILGNIGLCIGVILSVASLFYIGTRQPYVPDNSRPVNDEPRIINFEEWLREKREAKRKPFVLCDGAGKQPTPLSRESSYVASVRSVPGDPH